mgnify:CR=1 FL=1|jgi:hypothetical protein
MNKKMKNSAMNHSAILNQQKGVSTLLFTVLVGMSLTALSVGYISSLKTVQNSATTLHAQTQAQMQSMVGLNALNKFLSEQPLSNIQQIRSGNIKTTGVETIKFEMVSSNAGNFVFDITGTSGGASAVLRAQYSLTDKVSTIQQGGVVFAGGFDVNKLNNDASKDNIVANNITIEVPNSIKILEDNKTWAKQNNITFKEYTPRSFVQPSELKEYANYIYTIDKNHTSQSNKKNNSSYNCVVDNFIINSAASCSSFAFSTNEWTIDTVQNGNPPVGVYWFEGDVNIKLKKSTPFVATIIATGKIETQVEDDKSGTYSAFSPHSYYLNDNSKVSIICPENYLLQYCKGKGTLKEDMTIMPAAVSNILFLADSLSLAGIKRNSSDQGKGEINYYGTMIAKISDDGGSSDGKTWNSNVVVNINGNFIMTEKPISFSGNSKVIFHKGKDAENYIPTYEKAFTVGGIRYM